MPKSSIWIDWVQSTEG